MESCFVSIKTSAIVILVLLLLNQFTYCQAATEWETATTEQSQQDIQTFTKKIVTKELELLRLNTRFRIEGTKQSKWKPWRLALYNLGLFGASNAGLDHIAYMRWKTWQRPATANKGSLEVGPILLLIGHSISVSGVLIETALDFINDYKTRHRGFDRKTFQQRVLTLRSEIETLIAQREKMISEDHFIANGDRQLLVAEGAVLNDIKDCAILEYSRFSTRALKWKVARNISNLMVFAGGTTGGYIGSLCSLLAVANRKPRIVGPAGLGFTISGGFITTTPTVTRLSAILASKIAKKHLSKDLAGVNKNAIPNFDNDRQKLADLISSSSDSYTLGSLKAHAPIYESANYILDRQVEMGKVEAQKSYHDFIGRSTALGIVGGTKMAYGIQLMNAGYSFRPTPALPKVRIPIKIGPNTIRAPLPAPKGAANLFSKRVAQAATTFIPGTGFGILDTLQLRLKSEIEDRRVKKTGGLYSQILNERLLSIEQMERQINSQNTIGNDSPSNKANHSPLSLVP